MSDLLNPLSPINPTNQSGEVTKRSKTQKENTKPIYHENQEGVFLPSRGIFYLGEHENLEFIKVRPFDFTDEDILTTESYYTNGTIFDEILNNCIIQENFKASHLVSIDRDTILMWLRATSFGPEFEIFFSCPECGGGDGNKEKPGPGILKWNLTEIEIPKYDDDILSQLLNEKGVTITTPLTQKRIKITVPSIGRQNALEKRYKEKKLREKQSRDFYATISLLSVVSGVEVEEGRFAYDTMDIDAFFRKIKLPLSDSRYIIKKAGELNLKYDTAKTFQCKNCNHIEEGVQMPMLHRNFFWPEI